MARPQNTFLSFFVLQEASRRAELELEKARHTINQQSTV
jgi:hypothetical protein